LEEVSLYYGQFNLTRKIYQLLDDKVGLFYLGLLSKEKSGIRELREDIQSQPEKESEKLKNIYNRLILGATEKMKTEEMKPYKNFGYNFVGDLQPNTSIWIPNKFARGCMLTIPLPDQERISIKIPYINTSTSISSYGDFHAHYFELPSGLSDGNKEEKDELD